MRPGPTPDLMLVDGSGENVAVRIFLAPRPPPLGEGMSWRQLWRSGAFGELDLNWDTNFSRLAGDRDLRIGVGQRPLEALDLSGALRPIAFSDGVYPHGVKDLAPFEIQMTFHEEVPESDWIAYSWEAHGRPRATALYSPWQLLYVDHALRGAAVEIELGPLLLSTGERDAAIERVRGVLEDQRATWQALDAAWRPLVKLLRRLQNRYLPEVTGRTRRIYDAAQDPIQAWVAEREAFDPQAAASELGVSLQQVTESYWFLVERGLDREPRDGLELLRRSRPRSSHVRWRGAARQAQDHFDAAQVLRLFLTDLAGRVPEGPSVLPADGRQTERIALYGRGPAPSTSRQELKEDLVQTGLYPHTVHLIGEGESEKDIVWRLVDGLLGAEAAREMGFTDLGGSGSASRLNTMLGGFTTYAQRTVVIVDTEGKMAAYVNGAIQTGDLPEEDVLLFEANLEESNFSAEEMLDVLIDSAAKPSGSLPAVPLAIPIEGRASRQTGTQSENSGKAWARQYPA